MRENLNEKCAVVGIFNHEEASKLAYFSLHALQHRGQEAAGISSGDGERLHTIYEFEALLQRGAVQYVRPDVCLAGGLTHSKKIAALAEARKRSTASHKPKIKLNCVVERSSQEPDAQAVAAFARFNANCGFVDKLHIKKTPRLSGVFS